MHNGSSVGIYYTAHADFARLAPNHTLSHHLLTIIVNIVLCHLHFHVRFSIKSYAQLAPTYQQNWHTFQSPVGNLLRVHRQLGLALSLVLLLLLLLLQESCFNSSIAWRVRKYSSRITPSSVAESLRSWEDSRKPGKLSRWMAGRRKGAQREGEGEKGDMESHCVCVCVWVGGCVSRLVAVAGNGSSSSSSSSNLLLNLNPPSPQHQVSKSNNKKWWKGAFSSPSPPPSRQEPYCRLPSKIWTLICPCSSERLGGGVDCSSIASKGRSSHFHSRSFQEVGSQSKGLQNGIKSDKMQAERAFKREK